MLQDLQRGAPRQEPRGDRARSPLALATTHAGRWEQMTPEEREKFRQGLQSRWGPIGPTEPKKDAHRRLLKFTFPTSYQER